MISFLKVDTVMVSFTTIETLRDHSSINPKRNLLCLVQYCVQGPAISRKSLVIVFFWLHA